jgi:hypothetical protein
MHGLVQGLVFSSAPTPLEGGTKRLWLVLSGDGAQLAYPLADLDDGSPAGPAAASGECRFRQAQDCPAGNRVTGRRDRGPRGPRGPKGIEHGATAVASSDPTSRCMCKSYEHVLGRRRRSSVAAPICSSNSRPDYTRTCGLHRMLPLVVSPCRQRHGGMQLRPPPPLSRLVPHKLHRSLVRFATPIQDGWNRKSI